MRNVLNTVNIILLLPYVISSQILIDIVPGTDEKNPVVFISGSDRTNATTIDLEAFHITTHEVKANLQRLRWWVGVVNVTHASAYGFKDLSITLKPKAARIQSAKERTVTFPQEIIRNNEPTPMKFRPEVRHEVIEAMTFKWHEHPAVSVGHHIDHSLGLNRLAHTTAYGQEDFASKAITIAEKFKDEVVLNAGEHIKPLLEIKETTLVVRVSYELSLDGDLYFENVCVTQNYCYKKNRLDVNEYFRMLDRSPVVTSYELITAVYYHDPRVSIGDK